MDASLRRRQRRKRRRLSGENSRLKPHISQIHRKGVEKKAVFLLIYAFSTKFGNRRMELSEVL